MITKELTDKEQSFETAIPRTRVVKMIADKIYHEAPNTLDAERTKRAEAILDGTFSLMQTLNAKAEIIGSRPNMELTDPDALKDRDVDIHLIPAAKITPKVLSKKLKSFLAELPSQISFAHGVNVEAERQYLGFSIGLNGRIALVAPKESLEKGIASSMRIVVMQKPFPWGDPANKSATHENPTAKTPIVEFGFASYENGIWVSSKEFDPTQKFVIKLESRDNFKLVSTTPIYNGENINRLSPKSQAVLMLRSYANSQTVPGADLRSFEAVTGNSFYVFRYNLASSLKKVEEKVGIKALSDEIFVESVIRFTHPVMYQTIKSFNLKPGELTSLFNFVMQEIGEKRATYLKVLSLAKQFEITQKDPKSGATRDQALMEGRRIEKELYSFEANKKAAIDIVKG